MWIHSKSTAIALWTNYYSTAKYVAWPQTLTYMFTVTNCLQPGVSGHMSVHCGMRETDNVYNVNTLWSPQREHTAMITSSWYPNATMTSFPRYKDVIIASCACWLQLMYLCKFKFVSQETWNDLISLSIPLSMYFYVFIIVYFYEQHPQTHIHCPDVRPTSILSLQSTLAQYWVHPCYCVVIDVGRYIHPPSCYIKKRNYCNSSYQIILFPSVNYEILPSAITGLPLERCRSWFAVTHKNVSGEKCSFLLVSTLETYTKMKHTHDGLRTHRCQLHTCSPEGTVTATVTPGQCRLSMSVYWYPQDTHVTASYMPNCRRHWMTIYQYCSPRDTRVRFIHPDLRVSLVIFFGLLYIYLYYLTSTRHWIKICEAAVSWGHDVSNTDVMRTPVLWKSEGVVPWS